MSYIRVLSPLPYVNSGNGQTVAQLLANFPAGAAQAGKYAVVTDLYNMGTANGIVEIMRCRFDAVNNQYRWVPQRENFTGATAATTGSVSILPLITPPTLRATGTLLGNMSFAPSATNAWVGMRQRVYMQGTLGLFTAQITGLLGSNLTLLGNTFKDIEYSATGWFGV